MKELVKRVLPNPLVQPVKRVYNMLYYNPRQWLLKQGDEAGVIGPDQIYSEEWYRKMRGEEWRRDGEVVVDVLNERFQPESVVDLGCGVGIHLMHFEALGTDVLGVEGNQAAIDNALVSRQTLRKHDLREPLRLDRRHDLVLCLEVLEHLPARAAETAVQSILDAGRVAVVTAATPGQGGTHHVNEQPREYWIEKFENRGAVYDAEAVEALRDEMEVSKTTWIPDNLFVFQSPSPTE